ncbi:MAG: hypothetical protein A2Z31_06145 [candidate division NC10 bacterium RBG_16_65_8]|nr:MAG: hypothetical protein A2Z31_06145 [candidate division NC10 bacterium RBG_16_65_8]
MQTGRRTLAACLILLPVLALSVWLLAPAGQTWFELTDAGTGRRIASYLLADGDQVVLTWTNSLFGLPVTEVFVAGGGTLTLTAITFADPSGREPPRVRPEDVDDLYHTGGPFKAEGLARRLSRVVFRVGEIGNPTIRVGDRSVQLVREVGFGGAALLAVRQPRLWERIAGRLSR